MNSSSRGRCSPCICNLSVEGAPLFGESGGLPINVDRGNEDEVRRRNVGETIRQTLDAHPISLGFLVGQPFDGRDSRADDPVEGLAAKPMARAFNNHRRSRRAGDFRGSNLL